MGTSLDFVPITAADEFLHPVPPDAHYTSIETNLFGFNCPAAGLEGQVYLSYRPHFKTMKVMIYIWKGLKAHQLAAEYFNEHVYLPMIGSNADYEVVFGSCHLRVKVIDPLTEITIAVDDAPRGLRLRLTTRAAMPPAGRPGGGHFTQLMENSGSVTVRGETYDIAGFYVRDRSWGQRRGEDLCPGPPVNWTVGWFGRAPAFQISIFDTSMLPAPEYGPDWPRHVDPDWVLKTLRWESGGATANLNLRGGWWHDGDRTVPVTRVDAVTTLYAGTLVPRAMAMDIQDAEGRLHQVFGKTISMLPKMIEQNLVNLCCVMRWEYNGFQGFGDTYVVYDNESIYKFGSGSVEDGERLNIF